MRYKFTYDFLVEHTIYDVSKQLGKSTEEIEDLSSSELIDLYVNGSESLDNGDIKVDDEYYRGPEYYENNDELFAMFEAHYNVVVEGESYAKCKKEADELFAKADFGNFEYVDGCDCECSYLVYNKDYAKNENERN